MARSQGDQEFGHYDLGGIQWRKNTISDVIVKIGADLSSFLSGMKDAVFSMERVKEAVETLNQSFLGLAGIDLSIRAIREFVEEGVKIYVSMELGSLRGEYPL